jgi:hypothetical protein
MVYPETGQHRCPAYHSSNRQVHILRRVFVAGPYGKGIGEVGFACISVMNSTQTLMIDLVPGQGSSITACVSDIRMLAS